MNGILHRFFLPFRRLIWGIGYCLVVVAWMLAWWPVWVLFARDILETPDPPFRWMDKAPE